MAALLRTFSQCVDRMVSRRAADSASLSGAFPFQRLSNPPSAGPTVKAVEANFAVVTAHAADVARDSPTALAHTVAYFRAVQTLNDLLHTHGMPAPTTRLADVHRAAELVGLCLPDIQGSKWQTGVGEDIECELTTSIFHSLYAVLWLSQLRRAIRGAWRSNFRNAVTAVWLGVVQAARPLWAPRKLSRQHMLRGKGVGGAGNNN